MNQTEPAQSVLWHGKADIASIRKVAIKGSKMAKLILEIPAEVASRGRSRRNLTEAARNFQRELQDMQVGCICKKGRHRFRNCTSPIGGKRDKRSIVPTRCISCSDTVKEKIPRHVRGAMCTPERKGSSAPIKGDKAKIAEGAILNINPSVARADKVRMLYRQQQDWSANLVPRETMCSYECGAGVPGKMLRKVGHQRPQSKSKRLAGVPND